MAEDCLGLVSVVTEYGGVANDPALGVLDLNRSRIAGRQRFDVRDQFWFIEKATLFVGKDAVVGEIFLPRRLMGGNEGVVKLLSATDQFVLRNRKVCDAGEGYGSEKCSEHEFHKGRSK